LSQRLGSVLRRGYLLPAATYTATPVRRRPRLHTLLVLGGVVSVIASLVAVLASAIAPSASRYVYPPGCGRPPLGIPVHPNPHFTADDASFSVAYPGPGTGYTVIMESGGVTLSFLGGDGGTLRLLVSRPRTEALSRSPTI
jgi:hypothetical protein